MLSRLNGRPDNGVEHDEKTPDPRVQMVFHNEFNIDQLDSQSYRMLVSQALQLREKVESLVSVYPIPRGREMLLPIANQFEECVSGMYQLAVSRNLPQSTPAVTDTAPTGATQPDEDHTQIDSLPAESIASIDVLASDGSATPSAIHDDLSDVSVEQQFEDTLAALGVAYSLLLLLDGKDASEQQVKHLRDLLTDQITALSLHFSPVGADTPQASPNA